MSDRLEDLKQRIALDSFGHEKFDAILLGLEDLDDACVRSREGVCGTYWIGVAQRRLVEQNDRIRELEAIIERVRRQCKGAMRWDKAHANIILDIIGRQDGGR